MLEVCTARNEEAGLTVSVTPHQGQCTVLKRLPSGNSFSRVFGGRNDGKCVYRIPSKTDPTAFLLQEGDFRSGKPHGVVKSTSLIQDQLVPYCRGHQKGTGISWNGPFASKDEWSHGRRLRRTAFRLSPEQQNRLENMEFVEYSRLQGFDLNGQVVMLIRRPEGQPN